MILGAPKDGPGSADHEVDPEAISSRESRRLLGMAAMLIVCVVFVGQLLTPPKPIPKEELLVGTGLPAEELQLLEKRLESNRGPEPFSPKPELLEKTQDFVLDELEGDGMHHILHRVHCNETAESLARAAHRLANHAETVKTFGHPADPGPSKSARGQVFRVSGTILSYWQRVLDQYPNPAGLAWVWQAYFSSDVGVFMILITDKDFEPVIGRQRGDRVEIDAVFAKGYLFESEKKGKLAVPLLIGRDFRRIKSMTYEEAYPHNLGAVMLVVVTTCVGLLLLFVFWARSADSRSETAQREMLRRKLQRATKNRNREESKAEADGAAAPEADGAAAPEADGAAAPEVDAPKPEPLEAAQPSPTTPFPSPQPDSPVEASGHREAAGAASVGDSVTHEGQTAESPDAPFKEGLKEGPNEESKGPS